MYTGFFQPGTGVYMLIPALWELGKKGLKFKPILGSLVTYGDLV